MQRMESELVSVVYSGDVDASKEEIIAKVKVRTLVFIFQLPFSCGAVYLGSV